MDGTVSVTVGSLMAFAGFLLQIGLTIGAIAFSHGQLNQRVRSVEEKQKDHGTLATSVTRLETEMESVGREIKGLREDLKLLRFRNGPRPVMRQASPYDFAGARDWVVEDEN